MNHRRTCNWCRRCAVFWVVGSIPGPGCGQQPRKDPDPVPLVELAVVTEKAEEGAVEDARHTYYRGYLADVLAGDRPHARVYYREVLGFGAEEPGLVSQAALRLAGWAERRGERRVAMDLAVRASVLGADVPRTKAAADTIRSRIATTVRAQDIEVRGPAAGTVLHGTRDDTARQFEAAEVLLGVYHRRRLQPRLEALVASVRGKRAAMERAVRSYREVIASGEEGATVAAEFRIASLHYDFSLSLTFELPSELAPQVAASMRSSLRSEVRQVRAQAKAAYIRSLDAAGLAGPEAAPWSDASALGLASVEDLLRASR